VRAFSRERGLELPHADNVGVAAFAGSTLVRLLNGGDYGCVPGQLGRWTKAGGRTIPGLVRRRAAEGALFAHGAC
jgi:lysozyme